MLSEKKYDCIVVGGGIVGLTLAALLGKEKFSVAIVEGKQLNVEVTSTFDLRVSAVTRATQQIFSQLDLWQAMVDIRVSPYREMFVWDGTGSGKIHFSSQAINEPNLGHIVENRVMQKVLFERIQTMETINFFAPMHIQAIETLSDHVRVVLMDDSVLCASLVIGADGGHSFVRRTMNFPIEEETYFHEALVATVKTEKSHQQTAMQRFFQSSDVSGTLAFLPLSEPQTSSIVWTMQPQQMREVTQLSEDAFKHKLTAAFDAHLGRVLESSERLTFPLIRRHAVDYIKPRVALMGDAAHTVHPLAGQGLNLGIGDAAALAHVVCDAQTKGMDMGAISVLQRYQRQRKGPNMAMINLVGGFKHLFGSELAPVRFIRNLGLNLVDRLTPIKHQMIRYAMGLD